MNTSFCYFKLEIALALPVSNEGKKGTIYSATKRLTNFSMIYGIMCVWAGQCINPQPFKALNTFVKKHSSQRVFHLEIIMIVLVSSF